MRLALIGFGNVAQEFARILLEKEKEWAVEYDEGFRVVAVSTRGKGSLVNPEGIDLRRALLDLHEGGSFSPENPDRARVSSLDIIGLDFVDAIIETTTLDIAGGQPATDHLRSALSRGKHAITTNKGPIAFAYRDLQALAASVGKAFLFEGTVLDGAPVFNLVRENLPGCRITGFSGILNGTTNYILTRMEEGEGFAAALETAQKYGWAEADPSMDIDGWDAAVKVTALLNVLMGAGITPGDIDRQGIGGITLETVREARSRGQAIRLLCEGALVEGKPVGRVAPVHLPADHALAQIRGTSSALTLKTDLAGELTVQIREPKIRETAYAVVADLLTVARRKR